MLHKQQQTLFMWSVVFENEHAFCSWIHHVGTCTAFARLASGLETRVTLTRVSRKRLGKSDTWGGPSCDTIFVPKYVIVVELLFKWYTLYITNLIKNNISRISNNLHKRNRFTFIPPFHWNIGSYFVGRVWRVKKNLTRNSCEFLLPVFLGYLLIPGS
jgi:hypothetical protein